MMSRGLNKVMIIGHVGRDPDMRYTPAGAPVTTFSVSTSRSWKNAAGEMHTETEWFTVVAWNKLAEICKKFLTTGKQVYIEGVLRSSKWVDAEGIKHNSVEIVAREMLILSEKRDPNHSSTESDDTEGTEEEYPF
jgi:single-strand DNA-binding protein